MPALILTGRDGMGPQELQRHLDGLRATGREVRSLEPGTRQRRQPLGKTRVGSMTRRARIRVGELPALLEHRGEHALVALPQPGQERTRACIKQAPATVVDEVDTLTGDDRRKRPGDWAVKEHVLRAAQRRIAPVRHRIASSPASSRPR